MHNKILKTLSPGAVLGNVICFPFAGGNSTSFRAMSQFFCGTGWGVLAIDPPGHGTNTENLLEDLDSMVSLYERTIHNEVFKPFVLFGHSLGALVAYLLAQRLEKHGIIPSALILSAMGPPDVVRTMRSSLPDEELFDYIVGLGGMPSELINNIEFRKFIIPIFRSDYKALDQFIHTDQTPIRSPAYVFAGKEDTGCSPELLLGWKRWLTSSEIFVFDGGHMFVVEHPEAVAKKIISIADRTVVKR
ncbi:external thioesterase TEII [Paenibacillus forsythiae]|uniref:External thioesterase TEII n=1 Tax=Paenibacillus forsythiae TaxID=365616 RepID=A0ABU3H4R0_9BACL|nr:alpha/beta fold hydrolase [Paenibacillus forsythiae]MDT3425814.1 external thioesterase TEII [Paenibacillus forsythiae]